MDNKKTNQKTSVLVRVLIDPKITIEGSIGARVNLKNEVRAGTLASNGSVIIEIPRTIGRDVLRLEPGDFVIITRFTYDK